MARGIMVAETTPVEDREAEFNEWYDGSHIPEICAIPGFVGARRFRLRPADAEKADGRHRYLAIYELEAEDLDEPLAELSRRSGAGQMTRSDTLAASPPPVITVYELLE